MDHIERVFARPGSYILAINPLDKTSPKFSAASLLYNFIKSVTTIPPYLLSSIHFSVTNKFYSLAAYDCALDFNLYKTTLDREFDIQNIQPPNARTDTDIRPYFFIPLKPIVWFTEFCFVESIVDTTRFKQIFNHGHPILPYTDVAETLSLSQSPSLVFNFTIPRQSPIFSQGNLEAEISQVLSYWQEKHWNEEAYFGPDHTPSEIQFNYQNPSPHHHYMILTFNRKGYKRSQT